MGTGRVLARVGAAFHIQLVLLLTHLGRPAPEAVARTAAAARPERSSTLHPRSLARRARVVMLDRVVTCIRGHRGAWSATDADIARDVRSARGQRSQ